ncbi:hypothetical protein [Xylanibacter ruminicola]|uniref:hypothetical protein n=1 Tax=Xylanibacter ruminicola TaxID=839 RepID=UPI00048C62F7|nr:hypothetical protein [Xylanibacter ruminicola]
MADNENKTYADSDLTAFFRDYFMYHKANPGKKLGVTDINRAFYGALSGLDNSFYDKEFILAMKKDFEIISKQLEHIARDAQKDIAQDNGKWDKYSETERTYYVREIEAEWNLTASAIRHAIRNGNLETEEITGKKDKYLIKEKDWLEYAVSHKIKKRNL